VEKVSHHREARRFFDRNNSLRTRQMVHVVNQSKMGSVISLSGSSTEMVQPA
jgi:hypothetical protein